MPRPKPGPAPRPDGSRVVHVTEKQSDKPLSAAMKQLLLDLSWSEIRRLITKRYVQINGNICVSESRRVQELDVIKVLGDAARPLPTAKDIRVVYVDANVVVVEKPPLITSVRHAAEAKAHRHDRSKRRQHQPTLDELLPEVLQNYYQSSNGSSRPQRKTNQRGESTRRSLPASASRTYANVIYPVHRLDRETSGLMVFARTRPAEQGLISQFAAHTIERAYWAVAHGAVAAQTVDTELVRDRGDGQRGSTEEEGSGKRSVTHVRPIQSFGKYTLVECRLETGRTHQIRIHLSESGHPLCGERTYVLSREGHARIDDSRAPRVALHARVLGFTHPISGEPLRFESPWPTDLDKWLKRIGKSGQDSVSGGSSAAGVARKRPSNQKRKKR